MAGIECDMPHGQQALSDEPVQPGARACAQLAPGLPHVSSKALLGSPANATRNQSVRSTGKAEAPVRRNEDSRLWTGTQLIGKVCLHAEVGGDRSRNSSAECVASRARPAGRFARGWGWRVRSVSPLSVLAAVPFCLGHGPFGSATVSLSWPPSLSVSATVPLCPFSGLRLS
eukprot:6210886-Pleurochrysis_carterae.AAC.1